MSNLDEQLEEEQEKGYVFKKDYLEIYYLEESSSFKQIDPFDTHDFFSDQVFMFNDAIFSINSRIHRCPLRRDEPESGLSADGE